MISLSMEKANSKQAKFKLSNDDLIELAYELFVTVFEPMKIPTDQKLKMASGIFMKECVEQHNRQRHLKDFLRLRNYGKFKIKMEPLIISNRFLPRFATGSFNHARSKSPQSPPSFCNR